MKIIKNCALAIVVLIIISVALYKVIDIGFKQPCPPPEKPEDIPIEAQWNGGCDGGYWIELVAIKENKYRFRIYLDYKSEVLIDADFVAIHQDGIELPLDSTILNQIAVVEIDKIILKSENCYLQAVYPAYGGSSWEIIKEKGEH